jgi:Ca2+-binding EF-hand superfamily protein
MAVEAVQALDLKAWHLRRLRARFNVIDIDGSGAIDYDEFFESVGENRSPFTDKLFALIDLDGSGTIEFDEYIRVMATYCMFTKDEILRFCFECFDVDKSGTIDEKEFVELCKCINNANPAFPANFKKALEEFDVNEDGLIDYGEFLEIDRRYPLVLFPAFRLQDVMQHASLGETTWLKVIERYEESKRIEEYKANHGGKSPPDSFHIGVLKAFLPCLFREKVHIQAGKQMEDRHRQESGF